MKLNETKSERFTAFDDEIEKFPPRTTLRDIAICVGIGIIIALVIVWKIYA